MTAWFVVPCGADKLDAPAPARALYRSPGFALQLAAAEAEAEATTRDLGTPTCVLILSALHGLILPDDVLAPYDVKMGDTGSIGTAELQLQAEQLGIGNGDQVCTLLPRAYRDQLHAAVAQLDVELIDAYDAAPGIGYQRGVAASLVRSSAAPL